MRSRPLEVAYTDFTELVYAGGRRKAYLIPILDHASKLVLGWAVEERAVTSLALEAWERAKHSLRARRMDLSLVTIHHDQDPVFTSYAWTARLLLKDQVHVSYTLGGAQDNTEMEAFNSRFTPVLAGGARETGNRSLLLDVPSLGQLKALVQKGSNTTTTSGGILQLATEHHRSSSRPCSHGRSLPTIPRVQTCPSFGVHRPSSRASP